MKILKAYKYRIYPTKEQIAFFNKCFGHGRFFYNKALETKINDYTENKEKDDYKPIRVSVKSISDQYPFLKEVSADMLGYELRHLDSAYKSFFRNPGVNGFPKFKSRYDKASFSDKGRSIRWSEDERFIFLPKMKKSPLKIIKHREMEGRPITFTINRNASLEYHISILTEFEKIDYALPTTGNELGIDLGVIHFAIYSDGTKIENPKYLVQSATKLAKAQRKLSKMETIAKKEKRKLSESKNYQKQKLVVAKIHAKVARQREYFLHNLSQTIIENNDLIAVETLSSKEMLQNKYLAKSIADASWYNFVQMLEYKANWTGRTLIKIDQYFPSSQLCSDCGHQYTGITPKIREWQCPSCGSHHDVDINASINILEEAKKQL